MAKITYELDTNDADDTLSIQAHHYAKDLALCLYTLKEEIRNKAKHDDKNPTWEEVKDLVHQALNEYSIDLARILE